MVHISYQTSFLGLFVYRSKYYLPRSEYLNVFFVDKTLFFLDFTNDFPLLLLPFDCACAEVLRRCRCKQMLLLQKNAEK